jgi:hypothetical protein
MIQPQWFLDLISTDPLAQCASALSATFLLLEYTSLCAFVVVVTTAWKNLLQTFAYPYIIWHLVSYHSFTCSPLDIHVSLLALPHMHQACPSPWPCTCCFFLPIILPQISVWLTSSPLSNISLFMYHPFSEGIPVALFKNLKLKWKIPSPQKNSFLYGEFFSP